MTLLSSYTTHSIAEPNHVNLPTVVVSPKKLSMTTSQTLLSRQQLESANYTDINAYLYGLQGINLLQNKSSSISSITLRGASGGQGLLTFDGVPLFANFAGFYSLRNFPTEMVESINVQRGFTPQVSNSRTLGGAIHLQSRRVTDNKVHIQLEAGSNKTFTSSIAAGLENDANNVTIVIGRTHVADGDTQSGANSNTPEADNYRMERVLFRADKSFEGGYIQTSAYYLKTHEDTDGPGLTPDFKVAWLEDNDGWFTDEVLITQTTMAFDVKPNWQTRLQLAYTQDRQNGALGSFRPALPVGPFSMDLTSKLALVDWQNDYALFHKNNLLADLHWGISSQHQWAETEQNNGYEKQTVISPNFGFSLTGKDWNVSLHSQWNNYQEYNNHITYALGGEWQVFSDIAVWANVGKRFRAPGVNELLHPLFGNSLLKSEQSNGGEIGLHWQQNGKTRLNVSLYKHTIHNLIVLALNPATGATQSQNIATASVYGAETVLSQQWSPNWLTTLNYTYTDSKNRTAGKHVAIRPEHRLNLVNEWKMGHSLSLRAEINTHSGFWYDTNNTLWSGSSIKINSILKYQLTDNSQIYLRADNLTNDNTVEIYGFNYPHRSFYVGTSVDFF